MPPDAAAASCCSPGMDIRRIVDVDPDDPAMVVVTIAHVSGVRHVHNPIHKSQRASFFLHKGIESHAVILGGIHIDRPIRHAGVHVQRKNKMLNRISIDHDIEEE